MLPQAWGSTAASRSGRRRCCDRAPCLRLDGRMRIVLVSELDDEMLLGRTLREHALAVPVPDGAYVVLDPAVPLVPAEFVADLVERVGRTGRPHAGVRPVTDTVKAMQDTLVGGTVDRDGLWQLSAPVVLAAPHEVSGSLVDLVAALKDVQLVEAPALARRVSDLSEIALLEGLASCVR